jgi:hypothetical protein
MPVAGVGRPFDRAHYWVPQIVGPLTVNAFWSLTMYDRQEFVMNPLGRCASSDRDPPCHNV